MQGIITGVMVQMGWKTPIRFSSTAAGSLAKPGIYTLVEDVVAVDGGGEETYRVSMASRYGASPSFRQLLKGSNWFWGIGSFSVAVGTTLVVFLVDGLNIVFALGEFLASVGLLGTASKETVGWTLPWCWAAFGVMTTILWAKKALHREEMEWRGGEI